ncbi:hypothetical protein [Cupriavidus consociatus]|uniref:hypothetical protein n=1 Tax=Cupriavidus consociatus TaxID=2821357 RepID=UPI001FD792F0|nr:MULTISPECIES: hypothetical protein [unclassified Cupriavidus]MDK2659198.1 hypothetical protein [Cupriavidus sp. LEh21]
MTNHLKGGGTMLKRALWLAAASIAVVGGSAFGGTTGARDVYTDGAKVSKFDVYSDGARSIDRRDVFLDGARAIDRRDMFTDGAKTTDKRDQFTDGA